MDFRVAAYLEAQKCFEQVRTQTIDAPEFWANLIGAAANAALASVPDSVCEGAVAELEHRRGKQRRVQRAVQKAIKDKLDQ